MPACSQVLKEVAGALGYLHNSGVLHGDLKAANVLLAQDERGAEGGAAAGGGLSIEHGGADDSCDGQQSDRRGFVAKVTGELGVMDEMYV